MLGPLGSLAAGIALILILLLVLRFHAFLALFTAALLVALLSDRIAPRHAIFTVSGGFGNLMAQIGVLLVLASIIGKCLMESGAADRIVRGLTRAFGEGRENYTFLAGGYLLSISVFFDTVFYLLAPLVRVAHARRGSGYVLMICAAGAGAAVTHALVPPTPGPIAVAEELGVSLGLTFLVGILASVPPALAAGVVYARFIDRRLPISPRPAFGSSQEELESEARRKLEDLPRLWTSLAPILAPALLISSSTVAPMLQLSAGWSRAVQMAGDKDSAFLLGALLAIWLLVAGNGWNWRHSFQVLKPAITSGAVIALITCAGGAFGRVLSEAGIGSVIAEASHQWGISLLSLGFLTAALLRLSQGSATVAMVTTAGIVAPAISTVELSYHPVYLVAVIGFGASTTSWMNDSGFWLVGKLAGLTEGETLKTWTMVTTILALTGFLWVLVLSKLLPLA